ncbi:DMT family transporter [Amaricoccus sp.]|uniref:DMT family transporter n=1 Tax=Amaricoccus sp. TaxID=1872485 RepID=UPI00260787FA|nr:DMT family transporter [Amaricoccus sp.]HRO11650.1 DMT family transporter [Amaricoccus sp.]
MRAGRSENVRGAGFMVLASIGFSINDAFMKTVAGEIPLFQAVFMRGLIATLLIGILAWRAGGLRYRPGRRDGRLIAMRSLGEIGGAACFLLALFNMPLAGATAIMQSLPLAVTLGAALFLGEPVGWRRYLAIAVGFLGVLVIIRPGTDHFNAYALWAVAAIAFVVMRDLSTRRMSPGTPAMAVVFVTTAALTVAAGLGIAATGWAPLAPRHMGAFLVAALCLLVGYTAAFVAMRQGEIGFVQPFRYTLLLSAIVLGIVMFGEWPDAWMLAGSAIVVATGLFTLHREQRRGRTAEVSGPVPEAGVSGG